MYEKNDLIIRVNRSVKPSYPNGIGKLFHPELECSGPTEYNLKDKVEQWLHDDQKKGIVSRQMIYNYLKKNDILSSCLNLQDGFAIQQKGILLFRHLFDKKEVYLWSSVSESKNGYPFVPYLYERNNAMNGNCDIVLDWNGLVYDLHSSCPALRFR